jgi:hypothetical protein
MRFFLFIWLFGFFLMLHAQKESRFNLKKIQTGPYFGLQQGRNIVFELGVERRMKELKFKSPNSFALHAGFNYDYRARTLGVDAGFWFKPNRISFTFGATGAVRSNFNDAMMGFAPMLGYKIWLVHAFAGYYFYPSPFQNSATNQLFVSLRLTLTHNSKWKNQ